MGVGYLKSWMLGIALAVTVGSASASDLTLGFGTADYSRAVSEDGGLVELDYAADPFATVWGVELSFAAGALRHENGSTWVGVGLAAKRPLARDWFVEASVQPGYYDASDAINDLGSGLEFRSLLGVGRWVGPKTAITLAVSHKSNASTGEFNPGVNALSLRVRRVLN